MYSSILVAVAAYLITKANDKNAGTTLETAILSAVMVLAAFAIVHFFRVPTILDEERQAKEETLTKEVNDSKSEIIRLTQEPDIKVCVKAIFWDYARDAEGKAIDSDSNFFVRLELVNRNDVACTVDKFWMNLTLQNGWNRKILGTLKSATPELCQSFPYRDQFTSEQPTEEALIYAHALHVAPEWPLKRGCARVGWVLFNAMGVTMPRTLEGELPPHWVGDVSVTVWDHLGGKNHPHGGITESVTIFPAKQRV